MFCFLAIACARQRQVWFGALQRTHHADTKNVIRIYFDKFGELYPDKKFHIPYKSFFDPVKKTSTYKEKPTTASLLEYYLKNPDQLKELRKSYPVDYSSNDNKGLFYAIQNKIRANTVDEIKTKLKESNSITLIVFIHGFNDPDPTGDYQQLRDSIICKGHDSNRDFVYLEVFWDGLTCNQGNPAFAGIWGMAQQNSAYTSLGLRHIFNRLPENTKIRIITHSLGASVATGSLFNTFSKWKKYDGFDYLDSAITIKTPPQKDIRIGMLAPAIPGENTFRDINNRIPITTIPNDRVSRIVVGYNVNDLAVTKRILRKDISAKMGATSLGCNLPRKKGPLKDEVEATKKVLTDSNYNGVFSAIDFSEFGRKVKKEEHGLYYYLQRDNATVDFLKAIFEN